MPYAGWGMLEYPIFPGVDEAELESLQKSFTFSWPENVFRYPAPYQYQEETYHIPYRLGYPVHKNKIQNETQRVMKRCLMTRHYCGFERESALKDLFDGHSFIYPFVLPYVLRLISEYVYEIISFIYDHREELPKDQLLEFRRDNEAFLDKSRQRVLSYWQIYFSYRRIPTVVDGWTRYDLIECIPFESVASTKFLRWLESLED